MKDLSIFRLATIRATKKVFKHGYFNRSIVRDMANAIDSNWFMNDDAVKIINALGPFHCVKLEDLSTEEIEGIEEAVVELERILS